MTEDGATDILVQRVQLFEDQKAALIKALVKPGINLGAKSRICATVRLLDMFINEEGGNGPALLPDMRFPVMCRLQPSAMLAELLPDPPPTGLDAHETCEHYWSHLKNASMVDTTEDMEWAPMVDSEGNPAVIEDMAPLELAWRAYHMVIAKMFCCTYQVPGRVKGLFLHLLRSYGDAPTWSQTIMSQDFKTVGDVDVPDDDKPNMHLADVYIPADAPSAALPAPIEAVAKRPCSLAQQDRPSETSLDVVRTWCGRGQSSTTQPHTKRLRLASWAPNEIPNEGSWRRGRPTGVLLRVNRTTPCLDTVSNQHLR
jgi:hypothetical protein